MYFRGRIGVNVAVTPCHAACRTARRSCSAAEELSYFLSGAVQRGQCSWKWWLEALRLPFAILHRSGGTTGRRGSLVAEGRHRFATRHRCSLARLFCAAFTLLLSQNAHESINESVRELVCVCSLACAPIVFAKVLTLCMLESFLFVHLSLSACAPHLHAKFESGSSGFPRRWFQFTSFHFRVHFCSPPPWFLQVRSSCQ